MRNAQPGQADLQPAGRPPSTTGPTARRPTTTVEYSLDKKPKDVWNMIAGAQFALDRNWMFRVEAGFLTSRTSLMLATEYRWDGF